MSDEPLRGKCTALSSWVLTSSPSAPCYGHLLWPLLVPEHPSEGSPSPPPLSASSPAPPGLRAVTPVIPLEVWKFDSHLTFEQHQYHAPRQACIPQVRKLRPHRGKPLPGVLEDSVLGLLVLKHEIRATVLPGVLGWGQGRAQVACLGLRPASVSISASSNAHPGRQQVLAQSLGP